MKQLELHEDRRSGKQKREYYILLGLVQHYIRTGKPVGSNTLKEAGFDNLSSATIRNYFMRLEKEGYLSQQHSSGGRIPTHAAYRVYANEYVDSVEVSSEQKEQLASLCDNENHEIATYLQEAAERLSAVTHHAVFLSAPRFDNDFITDLRLIAIDHQRCLCVIVTNFGVVQTELLHTDRKLSSFSVKRIESYFYWRLTGHGKLEKFDRDDELLAQKLYNELMVRYIVSYSHFTVEEVYRTGFSKLLVYPDFQDTKALADSLGLFENLNSMRLLLKESEKLNKLRYWIGDDLAAYTSSSPHCTVMVLPYYINQKVVGAVGLLGPVRVPYPELFATLHCFRDNISAALTKSIYKFNISFRQPHQTTQEIETGKQHGIERSSLILLEDQREP